jgi:hypothetical protein
MARRSRPKTMIGRPGSEASARSYVDIDRLYGSSLDPLLRPVKHVQSVHHLRLQLRVMEL